jgi:hypothetical protein
MFSVTILANSVKLHEVICESKTMLFCHNKLAFFDCGILKLNDFSAASANHMVMMGSVS